jgi:hypothetical protein
MNQKLFFVFERHQKTPDCPGAKASAATAVASSSNNTKRKDQENKSVLKEN